MFPVANVFARTQGYGIAVWTAMGLKTITGILALSGLAFGQCVPFAMYVQTVLFSDKLIFWFRGHLYLYICRIPQPCIPRSYIWPECGTFLFIYLGNGVLFLITMVAVGVHYAGNRARYNQLSFFLIHRKRLSGRTTRLLRAGRYILRCFSFQLDAPSTDLTNYSFDYSNKSIRHISTKRKLSLLSRLLRKCRGDLSNEGNLIQSRLGLLQVLIQKKIHGLSSRKHLSWKTEHLERGPWVC